MKNILLALITIVSISPLANSAAEPLQVQPCLKEILDLADAAGAVGYSNLIGELVAEKKDNGVTPSCEAVANGKSREDISREWATLQLKYLESLKGLATCVASLKNP